MKPRLDIFLFHGVFRDRKEIEAGHADPQQEMTLEHYKRFFEFHLGEGCKFVSPEEIVRGLEVSGRHLLLTFDDGYFNNVHILPLLKSYRVPALFFISPSYLLQNKAFWWDVLWRERRKQRFSRGKIYAEGKRLKKRTGGFIEAYLRENFGADCMSPCSDIDRPFTPAELKAFAGEPFVHIGNHTCDHAILTNYPEEEARAQIAQAQKILFEMTGKTPTAFSYPNGCYSEAVVAILKELGFKLGITCGFKANRLPIDFEGEGHLTLNRFGFQTSRALTLQSRLLRWEISGRGMVRNLKAFLRRA